MACLEDGCNSSPLRGRCPAVGIDIRAVDLTLTIFSRFVGPHSFNVANGKCGLKDDTMWPMYRSAVAVQCRYALGFAMSIVTADCAASVNQCFSVCPIPDAVHTSTLISHTHRSAMPVHWRL